MSPLWPRRLLHVPSMKSLTRSKDGYYGHLHHPPFNAISYTWGRYEINEGSSLDITNVTWQIPRIDPGHFTVAQFHNVLNKCAGHNGLVWVDVACIDQEDRSVKMDEIGNQGDIFRLASRVFVWLTTVEVELLEVISVALDTFAQRLERMELAENSNEYAQGDPFEIFNKGSIRLKDDLARLLNDSWFSSLWTLQEACLCNDAILLTRHAEVISEISRRSYITGQSLSLSHLIGDCQTIKISLLPYAGEREPIKELLAMMDRSGLSIISPGMNGSNGSPLLYSAANHRTTTQPLDRIYGIMQAFGLTLGTSKEPERDFTLEELENQLGQGLNAISAITAQMHVHMSPPPLGASWRPSRASWLPDVYYLAQSISSSGAIIVDETGSPLYRGSACSLSNLHKFWVEANTFQENLYTNLGPYWQHYLVNMHLDAAPNEFQQHAFQPVRQIQSVLRPPSSCPCPSCMKRPRSQKDGLEKFLRETSLLDLDCKVLLLGIATLLRWVRPTANTKNPVNSSYTVSSRVGLLVVQEPKLGPDIWRRVGITSWEAGFGALKSVHEALWEPFECKLT